MQLRNESLREIQILNTYILDFSDTLWRYRAFNSMEQRSVYKEIDFVRLKEIQVSTCTTIDVCDLIFRFYRGKHKQMNKNWAKIYTVFTILFFFEQVEKPNFSLSLHGHQALIGFVDSFLQQVAFCHRLYWVHPRVSTQSQSCHSKEIWIWLLLVAEEEY